MDSINSKLDYIQLVLTLTSMVPWLGIASGAANTIISLLRGRLLDAALNLVGMVPYLGTATNAAKATRAGVAVIARYNKILDGVRRIATNIKEILKTGKYAGTLAGRLASRGYELIFCKALNLACFTAGTPIEGQYGAKPIESYRSYEEVGEACDWVWSRDECDADAEPRLRRVLRTFMRQSLVLNLHVGGKIIGTTHEHPFFAKGKGWTNAHALRIGDEIRLMDAGWTRVEGIADVGQLTAVYNMEVEDDHTYFVGGTGWGWAVWAHNWSCAEIGTTAEKAARQALINRGHKIVESIQNNSGHGIDLITRKGGKLFFWEVKGSTVGRIHLNPDQAKGAAFFVNSRLARSPNWKGMTQGELKLIRHLQ